MSTPKRRVVIADDNPNYCRLLNRMIGTWGYEPVVAANSYEASQILMAEPDTSLAVFDREMPTMDGVAALDAGANDMLGKSFHPLELKARLAAAERQVVLKRERVKAVFNNAKLLKGPVREEPVAEVTHVEQINHELRAPLSLPPQSMIPALNSRSLQSSYRLDESHLHDGIQRGSLRPHLMDRTANRCRAFVTVAPAAGRDGSNRSRSFTTSPVRTSGAWRRLRPSRGSPARSVASVI